VSKPWFRFHVRTLDNLKVQDLPGETFKFWINILCLARMSDGTLPSVREIAFRLRLNERDAQKRVAALIATRLIDETPAGLVPHDWEEMQFESDTSAARMRRHRDRHRDGGSDVTRDGHPLSLSLKSESVSVSSSQEIDTTISVINYQQPRLAVVK
jgi:hypothetical protein